MKSRDDAMALDEGYDLLRNYRRRFVLSYLDRTDSPVLVADLAASLVRWEGHAESDEALSEVITSLVHVHLPKLAGAGVVEYDADEQLVRDWSHPTLEDRWLTEGPPWLLTRTTVVN